MGEFVDEHELRTPRLDGFEIHFAEPGVVMINRPSRDDRQFRQQFFCLGLSVGFHNTHDCVPSVTAIPLCRLEHGIGFPHAGAHAKKDLQSAARDARVPQVRGNRTRIRSGAMLDHRLT